METITFSLKTWGIAQLMFNGLALLLSAFSILPSMLLPALAGGVCSLVIFFILFIIIVRFGAGHLILWLLAAAVVVSCFMPLYTYTYIQTGHIVLWNTRSRMYPAVVIAAVCGIISLFIHQRSLLRIRRYGLFFNQP